MREGGSNRWSGRGRKGRCLEGATAHYRVHFHTRRGRISIAGACGNTCRVSTCTTWMACITVSWDRTVICRGRGSCIIQCSGGKAYNTMTGSFRASSKPCKGSKACTNMCSCRRACNNTCRGRKTYTNTRSGRQPYNNTCGGCQRRNTCARCLKTWVATHLGCAAHN